MKNCCESPGGGVEGEQNHVQEGKCQGLLARDRSLAPPVDDICVAVCVAARVAVCVAACVAACAAVSLSTQHKSGRAVQSYTKVTKWRLAVSSCVSTSFTWYILMCDMTDLLVVSG